MRVGPLRRWLDVHILFGIMGPLLITLHTAMKFHGIVSISYFSMIAVASSGVFGRYVYMQIPRDSRGNAMSLHNARKRVADIQRAIAEEYELPGDAARTVKEFAEMDNPGGGSKIRDFVSTIRVRVLEQKVEERFKGLDYGAVGGAVRVLLELARYEIAVLFQNRPVNFFYQGGFAHTGAACRQDHFRCPGTHPVKGLQDCLDFPVAAIQFPGEVKFPGKIL